MSSLPGADNLSGNVSGLEGFATGLANMLPQTPPNYVPQITAFANNLTQSFQQSTKAAEQFQTQSFSNAQGFFQPLFQAQQTGLQNVGMAQANAMQQAAQASAAAANNSGGKK